MKYVRMGRTGLKVSPLTLGTMSFGAATSREQAREMLHACRDVGINHFDTANVYTEGRSETMLGELVSGFRDEVILATKLYFPTGPGPNQRGASRRHIALAVDESLRRLQTDRVDVLYIHRFDPETGLEETVRGLEDVIRAGKVLYPAISNFAAWQTMQMLGVARELGATPIAAIQPMYNLVKRQAEVEILPMAQAMGLGVFPYSPLGGGLLTGKYGPETRPASGRLVENTMYATRYGADWMTQTAGAFTELARDVGHHPVSLAVAWVMAHEGVTAPILGGRNMEQLAPALKALEVSMTPELYARIAALSPEPAPATDRNEERTGHKPFAPRT